MRTAESSQRTGILLFLLVMSGLASCGGSEAGSSTTPTTTNQTTMDQQSDPQNQIDPNSMQALQDAIQAKERLPGKAHFDQACAVCHLGAVKKAPHKDMIGLMTPESILNTMTTGVMQNEAAILSDQQKREVAEYLAGTSLGTEVTDVPTCSQKLPMDTLTSSAAINWGIQPTNTRSIPNAVAGINQKNVASLKTLWAVSFPGANRVRSQPTFAGGLVYVGSHNGRVYALDAKSGCKVWAYQASAEVRTAIVVAQGPEPEQIAAYFGDVLGNVYALDARTGTAHWRIRADDHPNATITGTPSYANGNLHIPISSLEVSLAINPEYACCTFRGSILTVDAGTGETLWKTYTISEPPVVQKKNAIGTDMIGPSGAVVWNSPAIDTKRGLLYFGTGENMSSPATKTSDALFAMDLSTGEVKWTFQATENDAWNVACDTDTPENCPEENGPDFDFGGAAILVESKAHGQLLVSGQKSGWVHALNPDSGAVIWQTQVGRGGIQGGIHFGMAATNEMILVPISDMSDGRAYTFPDSPGMHALDIDTGKILWSTVHEDECNGLAFCHPGISQVPTVIGDLVIAGAMDGTVRAYRLEDGKVLWDLDTKNTFTTNSGNQTSGGSFGGAAGPIAQDGMLLLSSGYGIYNHMPGNLLLMLAVD
ncbi:MAG: PQQ-binding-like beta-propeller repeat protein [Pseudomonadota bacterium]